MPLPRSLTQILRQGQLTVGAGWRAYFAPFNQALAVTTSSTVSGPTIYDLQVFAKFLDANFQPVPMEQTAPAAPAAKQATSKAAKWGTPIQ